MEQNLDLYGLYEYQQDAVDEFCHTGNVLHSRNRQPAARSELSDIPDRNERVHDHLLRPALQDLRVTVLLGDSHRALHLLSHCGVRGRHSSYFTHSALLGVDLGVVLPVQVHVPEGGQEAHIQRLSLSLCLKSDFESHKFSFYSTFHNIHNFRIFFN